MTGQLAYWSPKRGALLRVIGVAIGPSFTMGKGARAVARYGKKGALGRIILLLLLILAMVLGGALWFDYLGLFDLKKYTSPLMRLLGREVRTSVVLAPGESLSLDEERLSLRLEALELREQELNLIEEGILERQREIEQMARELEDRQKALEEQEKSFNDSVQQFENRRVNVEQNARYLTGMPPVKAVDILVAMDDQDIIDVFRMTEEIATAEGTASLVAYWLSLFPADRAAEIQRKMAGKPRIPN